MNGATDVKAQVLGRLAMNDEGLFKVPWVLFRPTQPFLLTPTQRHNLGKYLLGGGFVFGDGHSHFRPFANAAFRSLHNALLESLEECGVKTSIDKLPTVHPLYHCYFDFSGPPGGCDIIHKWEHRQEVVVVGYVEGIELGGGLLALVTGKEYAHGWAVMGPGGFGPYTERYPTPSFRFGVNTIIPSLTQEGSITHQLMGTVQ